jgi:hypothetical protein
MGAPGRTGKSNPAIPATTRIKASSQSRISRYMLTLFNGKSTQFIEE